MKQLKIALTFIASSASLVAPLTAVSSAKAETITNIVSPQFIEIVRQPNSLSVSSKPTNNYTVTRGTKEELVSPSPKAPLSEDELLNDDKIGDVAIAKYGCDCAGCRRAIAQILAQIPSRQ